MSLSQQSAPLFAALTEYVRRAPAVFHVPGHKQGRGAPPEWRRFMGRRALEIDLTEAPGLDDLHAPEGAIAEAERLAAEAFGAASSYFLVGGTTAGLHALILASCAQGSKVLVPRHAHRSVLGGLILAGARPVWLPVDHDPRSDTALGVSTGTLTRVIREHPDARTLILVHPTFYGVASPLAEQIEVARVAGLTVIADEAHASHFAFAPGMPASALSLKVDGSVQSLHKTGGSLTQSSICHLGSTSKLDSNRLREMLRLVQSTSPSYLLMASLDLARRQLALYGASQWAQVVESAYELRKRLGEVIVEVEPPYQHDPSKLIINAAFFRMTGFALARLLWEQGIAVESAGQRSILAVLSPGDSRHTTRRLTEALAGVSHGSQRPTALGTPPPAELVLTPRDAYLARKDVVPLTRAGGRVAAEIVAPYPPGIPVVVPGERITQETICYLSEALALGYHMQGPANPSLQTIQVVKE